MLSPADKNKLKNPWTHAQQSSRCMFSLNALVAWMSSSSLKPPFESYLGFSLKGTSDANWDKNMGDKSACACVCLCVREAGGILTYFQCYVNIFTGSSFDHNLWRSCGTGGWSDPHIFVSDLVFGFTFKIYKISSVRWNFKGGTNNSAETL